MAFVMDNVSPEYFRIEANDAVRPVRGPDLERVVKLAYDIRSRNVHVLEDLPPEAWVLGGRADTVSPPDTGIMLSHEGLARLARHVVKNYIAHAPKEIDSTFNWRDSLPGKVRMRFAPQYWIGNATNFDPQAASSYFSGFVENLVGVLAGHAEGVPPMGEVLERIEQLTPGIADGPNKTLMVAIYALWHSHLAPEEHQPNADNFLASHERVLRRLEAPSFVVGLLGDQMPKWSAEDWRTLATERHVARSKRRHLELPAGLNAALQVMAAERQLEVGRPEEAARLARFAVEELPGYKPLVVWEDRLAAEKSYELDLGALLIGVEPDGDVEIEKEGMLGVEKPETSAHTHAPAAASETTEDDIDKPGHDG